MTLLSIFSISKEDLSDAEVQALSPCSVLVVQATTEMLLQTMLQPIVGHKTLVSSFGLHCLLCSGTVELILRQEQPYAFSFSLVYMLVDFYYLTSDSFTINIEQ